MGLTISIAPHPLLELGASSRGSRSRSRELATPIAIAQLLDAISARRSSSSDTVRTEVAQLLRHGGFKPAGRSKPASEYLVAAHAESRFPRINAAVDACNVASLYVGSADLPGRSRSRRRRPLPIARAADRHELRVQPVGPDDRCERPARACSTPKGRPARRSRTRSARRPTTARARRSSIVWGTTALAGPHARSDRVVPRARSDVIAGASHRGRRRRAHTASRSAAAPARACRRASRPRSPRARPSRARSVV